MEENKKETESNSENKTNQKAFWIVGIAVIVFLILLLGSIIGLKFTRDGINGVLDKFGIAGNNPSKPNYVVLDDGTKENTNEDIKNAEFTIEGRKIYNFVIRDREGLSTVEVVIENITEEVLPEATFKIGIYNSNNKLIADYTILTSEIEPMMPTMIVTSIMKDCSNASRIEVEMIGGSQTSGE